MTAPLDPPRAFLREIAAAFHEEYEKRAPTHGWQTNPLAHVPFDELPIENRTLMCSVISALLRRKVIALPLQVGELKERDETIRQLRAALERVLYLTMTGEIDDNDEAISLIEDVVTDVLLEDPAVSERPQEAQ